MSSGQYSMSGNLIALIDLKSEIYTEEITRCEFILWEGICDMWGIHQEEIIASFGSVNVDDVVIGCFYNKVF